MINPVFGYYTNTHCKFGTYLEEALRDRFVCGLRNEAMQRRIDDCLLRLILPSLKLWSSLKVWKQLTATLGHSKPLNLPSRKLAVDNHNVQDRNNPALDVEKLSIKHGLPFEGC